MVGDNIKAIRTSKGITQSDLAKALGVAEGTVRRYESGNISPPLDRLEQIADILEVDIAELIKREKSYDKQFQEKFNPNFMKNLLGLGSGGISESTVDRVKEILVMQVPEDNLKESNSDKLEDYLIKFLEDEDMLHLNPLLLFILFLKNYDEIELKDIPNEDLWFIIDMAFDYNRLMLKKFYEDEYLPIVKDSKAMIEAMEIYKRELSALKMEVSELKTQLHMKEYNLAECKKLLGERLESIYEKEVYTESDISKLKSDIEINLLSAKYND